MTQLQQSLMKDLEGTGWGEHLNFFLRSYDMECILNSLVQDREDYRFTPALKDIFAPFRLCHYNDVRVVMCRAEPFLNPLLNTGLSVQCRDDSCYEVGPFKAFDFTQPGILWINTNLTTRIRKGRQDLWRPFMNVLLDVLNRKQGLTWIFIGENTYKGRINKQHRVFEREDLPQEYGQECDMNWEEINTHLVNNNTGEIILPQKEK